jgi:DNA-binding MarR family transcriptional regulator
MDESGIREILRLYLDAVTLAEPARLTLWQSAELTLVQLGALSKLRDGPVLTGKLAKRLGMSPASLTRVLDRLESRGLVSRSRENADRRRVWIELLPAGRDLIDSVAVLDGGRIHRAVRSMDKAERTQLLTSLGRLVELTRSEVEGDVEMVSE